METINNASAAVKNAIWGEGQNTTNTTGTTGTSSGHSGNTTVSGQGHTETHKSMIDDSVTESKPYSGKYESDPMAEDSYNADRDRDQVPQKPTSSTGGPPQGSNITGNNDTNKNSMSNSNEPNTGFGAGAHPSVGADPSSGQAPSGKHQGSEKPNQDPDDVGSGGTPGGASGGPGANAGGAGGGTGPGGMKLPDEKKSTEEGTGEKWEKTTGLHADGGDFDAARPGAAREADRLMELAGIKHGEAAPSDSGASDKKEKKWYGVDHSGFGGHGSHANKPSSRKNSTTDAADLPTSRKDSTTTGDDSSYRKDSTTNTDSSYGNQSSTNTGGVSSYGNQNTDNIGSASSYGNQSTTNTGNVSSYGDQNTSSIGDGSSYKNPAFDNASSVPVSDTGNTNVTHAHLHGHEHSHTGNISTTGVDNDVEKKGLAEKVKEKLHV